MKPVRYKGARSDASINSIERRIEKDYRLPIGSVRLVHPSGRKARADGTVATLLKNWKD